MKRRRHTPKIIRKLAEGEKLLAQGKDLDEVVRHLEITDSTWHRWRNQYGGMKADDAKRLKELERQNARLKRIVADQALDIDMLKEVNRETSDPGSSPASSRCSPGTVRGVATSSVSRGGPASLDATTRPTGARRRGAALAGVAACVLDASSPVGMAPRREPGPPRRLEGEHQEDPTPVA